MRLLRGHRLARRTSGYRYLTRLLEHPDLRSAKTFWVMPSAAARERTRQWLAERRLLVAAENFYIAPIYPRCGAVEDLLLVAALERQRPDHVFVCVGGGVQEKLGLFLKRHLSYEPGIHCIGAAIAFLTGEQARIPLWADRVGLGWLARCIREPKVFVPRYARALSLAYLVLRYDEKAPRQKPTSG
jgi:UDP-N-acetyl-D-mannosaminuronic acid transferase (WecB/TagA/CpsF family)